MKGKVVETGISTERPRWADHEGRVPLPGTWRRRWDTVLTGVLVYWGLKHAKEGSGNGQPSPYRPHWGNLRGAHFTGDFDDGGLWKQSVSFYGSCARGTWRKGSFTGHPEEYVKEGSADSSLHWGPVGEPGGGGAVSFTGEFERQQNKAL
jgi:hypothetical protein